MDHGLTILVQVKDGKACWTEPMLATIKNYLRGFDGKPVQVKFSKPRKERSVWQNRYMWGIVYKYIAVETGHTENEIHAWLVDEFLPRRFIKIGDKEKEIRRTTTDLTTVEMETYLERCRVWAGTTLGIVIPLPNES